MKRKTRILMVATLMIAAGTMALQAQVRYGRGTGACINYSQLNDEQEGQDGSMRTEILLRWMPCALTLRYGQRSG
jgi:hypothetical protein